ncbi:inositol polyphosphate kinase family protein [Endozoicomonas sp.]|uniref:inositol polyphosphate kinase family protein n=1 Tax=Endozoicomonas sp. TaxID=1892382 RepID=UPI003AF5ED2E
MTEDSSGVFKDKEVRRVNCTPFLLQTAAGHPDTFIMLSENYILKTCKPRELVNYSGRRSNGLNDVLPPYLPHDSIESLEPMERERFNTFISSSQKPFVILENLRQGLRQDMLLELDIKVGFRTASRKELMMQSHPFPWLKREKHRFLDYLYRSNIQGWRIESMTIAGNKLTHSKLLLSHRSKHFLQLFMSKLSPEKQKLILLKIKEITEKLHSYPRELIGPSILILTDSTKASHCKVHIIDPAHDYHRKKQYLQHPEVAIATSQFHGTVESLVKKKFSGETAPL